jgi:hypothetical protein
MFTLIRNSLLKNHDKVVLSIQIVLFILSISLVLNFLPNVIFRGPVVVKYYAAAFLLLGYLYLRGFKTVLKATIELVITNKVIKMFFITILFIFCIEIFRYPINSSYSVFLFLIVTILIPLFLIFLSDLFINYCDSDFDKFMQRYVKVYYKLSLLIVVLSVLVFFLLKLDVINVQSWRNVGLYGIDFQQRQEQEVQQYYSNPFFITVILPNYLKLNNYFGEFGSFAGWSYEPHIACFFLTPAFFMVQYFETSKTKKIIAYILFSIFYLLSFVTTTLLGFVIILVLYLIKIAAKKTLQFFSILLFIAFLFFLISFFWDEYIQQAMTFLLFKVATDNTSSTSTLETYKYLVTPTSLLGNGVFIAPIIKDDIEFAAQKALVSDNIGFLPFIGFAWLYLNIVIRSALRIFKPQHAFVGLILLYLAIHVSKFPFHVLSYPFFYFFIFLFSISTASGLKKL